MKFLLKTLKIIIVRLTRGLRSLEYQRLYTEFLSEGLIFAYLQTHHRKRKNQHWHRIAALKFLNTIAINVLYIDKAEDNAFS